MINSYGSSRIRYIVSYAYYSPYVLPCERMSMFEFLM